MNLFLYCELHVLGVWRALPRRKQQPSAAAAAKRLFWHLTARQIFTASSSVRLSHRKYPTHPSPSPRGCGSFFFIAKLEIYISSAMISPSAARRIRRREIASPSDRVRQEATSATYKRATNSFVMYASTLHKGRYRLE